MTLRSPSFVLSLGARLAFALALGLTVAVFAYSAVRIVDVVLFPEPNPVVVVWTDRSRFIWRAAIAAYLGGASVFGGVRLAHQTSEQASKWLERAVIIAAVCLLGQSVFVP
jgi:hypothetical protein